MRLLLLLALLTAFPPLSTDMYLPALPMLQELWGQPPAMLNLTLVSFFAAYCICLLVYGPLSDRFGRRRPLLAGIGLYVAASMLCAVAGNVTSLIVFRVFQAAGAASASAISMAICKDMFQGRERERILAIIGVIMALAPMLAPTFGGWIMLLASWRVIFIVQGIFGIVGWFGVLRMPETLETPSATSAAQIAGTYLHLLRNKRYVGLTLMLTCVAAPHFAFIGGSADIYISGFGLSEQAFGYFFALNAMALMIGSIACTRLQSRVGSSGLIMAGYAGIMLGGALMLTHWLPGPWRLSLPMALASFSFGLSRPPSNNLILEQVDRHAGAASSLMIFAYFMTGALAMWLIALDWPDKITTIGAYATISGGVILAVWLLVSRIFFPPAPEPKTGR